MTSEATPGSDLLASLLPFVRAGDVSEGEPSFWFAEGAQEVLARLAAKPADEGISPERLKQIRRLARSWAEIASDEEAAPTGSMLGVINELLTALSTTKNPKP